MTSPRKTPKRKAASTAPTGYDEWCAEIVATLTTMVETSTGTWVMPWNVDGMADLLAPRNAATGVYYQGANVWALALAAMDAGYTAPVWATYKQWEAMGAQVRQGSHGTGCVRWLTLGTKDVAAGTDDTRMVPKFFKLFNAAQVEGYEPAVVDVPATDAERCDVVDAFLTAQGATVHHGGNRAFYSLTTDAITLPTFEQFTSTTGYYGTAAHEYVHWTGGAARLKRTFGASKATDEYAFEELVAEMGSALVLARFGLATTPREDHAQYLASWVRCLTDKPKALAQAAKLASSALTFLLERAAAATAVVAAADEIVAAAATEAALVGV